MAAQGQKTPVQLEKIDLGSRTFSERDACEFLEGKGLVDVESSTTELEACSGSKIEELSADFFAFLSGQREAIDEETLRHSPFNTLAGSSIRGDSGCSNVGCRAEKLASLATYAAMYADRMLLPTPLGHPIVSKNSERLRNSLIQSVVSVLELRPLVERGIVRPVTRALQCCEHHAQLALRSIEKGEDAVDALAEKNVENFAFSYEVINSNPYVGALHVRGPEKYIDHGSMYWLLTDRPTWLTSRISGAKKYRVPRSSPAHRELVKRALRQIVRDVVFHRQVAPRFKATYLTDMAGEKELIEQLSNDDALAMRTALAFENLTHEIPLITNLPIRTILRIRDDSPGSFELYRSSLNKIVRERLAAGSSMTRTDARALYEDALAPALAQLQQEADRQQRRWARKSLATAALAAGVVTLGATGVLQAPQVLGLLGGAVVKGLTDQLAEAHTEPATSEPLYFLLQLTRAGRQRKNSRRS